MSVFALILSIAFGQRSQHQTVIVAIASWKPEQMLLRIHHLKQLSKMSFQILPSSLAIDLIAIFFIGAALSGALLIAFSSSIGAALLLLIIGAAILAIIGGGAIAISYYGYPGGGGGGIILYLSSALSISLRFLSFSSLSMD
jgi:membrane protein required for beta-lactamase induction